MKAPRILLYCILLCSLSSVYVVNASPQVVLVQPPANATGVPTDTPIIAFFSVPLLEATVIPENVLLNNGEIPIIVQLLPGPSAIQIIPLVPLTPATEYTVALSERISDMLGDELTGGFTWSFSTVGPTIDGFWVSDSRCDVGSNVAVAVHLSWGNGTYISAGTVFFEDETVPIDALGWANYTLKNIKLGQNALSIIGVDCGGVKNFLWTVDLPEVVGDRIELNLELGDNRIDVGEFPVIEWHGNYAYDDASFTGQVEFNEFNVNQVGKQDIRVISVTDPVYGLTSFQSNNVSLILDRVKITETGFSAEKAKLSEPLVFWCKAVYEYDDAVFDGSKGLLSANGEAMSWSAGNQVWEKSFKLDEPGSLTVEVTGVRDDLHGLTVFTDAAGSKTALWEISFLEAYWPILLFFAGFSIFIIIFLLKFFRKKGRKEGDYCKEHPEVVEAEKKACWDAQIELETAVSNVRDAFNRAMPRWRENLRTVGRLLTDWDLKVALISHWTGAEKEIYESAEKVQKVAGLVTSAAGKAKTAFKEGGEAAMKELGTDVAKEVGGSILGEISSTLGQVLELEDWAVRQIGVGIAEGLTGINPRQKASNIRKNSEIVCTDLMSWINHSYAWNSGRRPPDTLKSCIDEMQKMLNDLNKAMQDFENAVKGFRCTTCKMPPEVAEEIQKMQQKINDIMKAYGDLIDKVEQRLKQARKIYNRKDVYPASGHEWMANSPRWSEQIDRVLKEDE